MSILGFIFGVLALLVSAACLILFLFFKYSSELFKEERTEKNK